MLTQDSLTHDNITQELATDEDGKMVGYITIHCECKEENKLYCVEAIRAACKKAINKISPGLGDDL